MKNIDKAIDALNRLTDRCMAEENVTEYDKLSFGVRQELNNVSYHISIDGIDVKDAIESTKSSIKFYRAYYKYERDGYDWIITFYKEVLQILRFLED